MSGDFGCAHASVLCEGFVEEVVIDGKKHFLCHRCQTVLQQKLQQAELDGMPAWWKNGIVCNFFGEVNELEIRDDSFLAGY